MTKSIPSPWGCSLPPAKFRVLAINPGSTSTKFALYVNETAVLVKNIRHSDSDLEHFRGRPILEQQEYRAAQIQTALAEAGEDLQQLNAVVGRGGSCRPWPVARIW